MTRVILAPLGAKFTHRLPVPLVKTGNPASR
ncbi:MAG: hypothetical protein BMS9Abin26_0822 [Gammaproteobacteria bacterium]|nr:MAG: hypothetical protein BMS9Abin26_0822 [Gammaproteobacteria bacterium]